MNRKRFFMSVGWSLLLLMTLMPVKAWAEDNSQAMLYIEKTNGEVVKVPITKGYPQLKHEVGYDMIPVLNVVYKDKDIRSMKIHQSDIKRLYTAFEATGIVTREMDTDNSSEKVYSLSGRIVGSDSRNLNGQPKGVYIIKKGTNHKKIVKP